MSSPEEYIEKARRNRDRVFAIGVIAQLNTEPPTRFYAAQLTRVTNSYISKTLFGRVIVGLRDVGMLTQVGAVPPNRIVYECSNYLAWTAAKSMVQDSGIVVPEIEINPNEVYRRYNAFGEVKDT